MHAALFFPVQTIDMMTVSDGPIISQWGLLGAGGICQGMDQAVRCGFRYKRKPRRTLCTEHKLITHI